MTEAPTKRRRWRWQFSLRTFLIGSTLIRSQHPPVTAIAALLTFGLLWLAVSRQQKAQAIAASAIGFGGAALLVAMQHVSPLAAGLLMLSAAGFAFGAALYSGDDLVAISAAIAGLSGSAILLQGNARSDRGREDQRAEGETD